MSLVTPRKYDLEERLIDFAVLIIDLEEALPSTKAANHLGGQLLRSGTSPALNYGEAQAAESKKDFIHKIKIVLKELRETHICIRIMERKGMHKEKELLIKVKNECQELVRIFIKSVGTATGRKSE
ncbi:MAG: four helix bundle protein [Flavobacteriales bacterium]|nr:four helix bundle protein [Flavobacteriales bacterium]